MLDPVVSCLVYGFDMLIIYIFFSRVASRKYGVLVCLGIGLLLFELGSGANLLFQNNIWINTAVSFLLRIIFAQLCFRLGKIASISYAAVLVVLNLAVEMAAVLLVSALAGKQAADYNSNLSLLLLECSSCKLLFFVTCLLLPHFAVADHGNSKYQLTLLLYPLLSCFFLFVLWYLSIQPNVSSRVQSLLAYSGIAVFISTALLFIIYQHQVEADMDHLRIKSENERLQLEKSYYDILEQQNRDLMIYAHDAKNHLNTIHALNTDPAIEKYLTALQDQLNSYTKNCHSGNKLLDVMIDKYTVECQHSGVRFEYDVRGCNLAQVEDMDLVAILGNLLDNALRAATASQAKTISLETTTRNGYDVIVLSNSCDTPPHERAGRLLTTKGDKAFHGQGLKSVAKALKKYHGDHRWDYDGQKKQFIMTVMIFSPNKA